MISAGEEVERIGEKDGDRKRDGKGITTRRAIPPVARHSKRAKLKSEGDSLGRKDEVHLLSGLGNPLGLGVLATGDGSGGIFSADPDTTEEPVGDEGFERSLDVVSTLGSSAKSHEDEDDGGLGVKKRRKHGERVADGRTQGMTYESKMASNSQRQAFHSCGQICH